MLDIKDRPGVMPKAVMRAYFERAIADTKALRDNTPIGAVTINGAFSHYMDATTDSMWIGFALGLRCAERLAAAPTVAAPAAPAEWVKAVQEAYGWLWNINNEPMAPIPMLPEGKAAYQARKPLRDLLTMEQRGEAINSVRATLENMGALPPAVPKPEALGSLLRKPVKSIREVSAQIPGGCYCPPGTCSAPVIMGRQTPCLRREDPEPAAPAAPKANGQTKRFFSFSENTGFCRHHTAEEARAMVAEELKEDRKEAAFNNEWSDGVEHLAWGEIRESAVMVTYEGDTADYVLSCTSRPAAPAAGEPTRERLIEMIAEGLRGTFHCHRVWEAWSVGTMSEDDFSLVEESETPAELADTLLAAFSLSATPTQEPAGNPPIPIRPCFRCGVPTCETYSVYGVGHDACFRLGPVPAGQEVSDMLYDAIKEVLLHHRLSYTEGDDAEALPLVDMLCPPGSRDIAKGRDEVTMICDAIYNDEAVCAAIALARASQPAAAGEPLALAEKQGLFSDDLHTIEPMGSEPAGQEVSDERHIWATARSAVDSMSRFSHGELSAIGWPTCESAARERLEYARRVEAAVRGQLSVVIAQRLVSQTAEAGDIERDAARYRWLRSGLRGIRGTDNYPAFQLPTAPIPNGIDIMKGSVAQHFDSVIDAALSAHASRGASSKGPT